jgi:hypothetical protein
MKISVHIIVNRVKSRDDLLSIPVFFNLFDIAEPWMTPKKIRGTQTFSMKTNKASPTLS